MFVGNTIVITGAGAGIGRSLALKFAASAANVWAVDLDSKGLAATADEAAKYGHTLVCKEADVTDLAAMARIRDEALAATRRLDVWVNNAGIAGLGDFLEAGAASFDRVIDVNLRGVANGSRVALETMEAAGTGALVNMASVAGHLPAPLMSAYCASKHAVVGLTRSLQAELRMKASPVHLMLVSPGFVDTAIIAKGEKLGFPEWLSFLLATPDGVADTVIRGLKGRRDEIYPTWNGKLLRRMYGVFPRTTLKSSRMMMTSSWKEFLTGKAAK